MPDWVISDIVLLFAFLVVCLASELIFEVARVLDSEKTFWLPALLWFLAISGAAGFGSAVAVPERVLRPGPFPGTSLVLLPCLLAIALHGLGWLRRLPSRPVSHLASWYGGVRDGLHEGRRCPVRAWASHNNRMELSKREGGPASRATVRVALRS